MRELTRRQRRAALLLAAVALLFCAFDVVGAPFRGARDGMQGYLGSLYRGTDSVLGPTRRFVQALPHSGHDAATTSALRATVATLQRQAATSAQEAATSAAIQRLQLQANRGGYRVLPARVVAIGPAGGFDWTIVLDAGERDGAKVDQTVLAGAQLVGRVIRVSSASSTVLLAADPGSGVGVRDQSNAQIGVVTGAGTAGSSYSPLDPAASPKAGDQLVTGPQGGGSVYVAGLTVGRITAVHHSANGAAVGTVAPAIDVSTLDVVGVVLLGGRTPPRPALTPSAAPPSAPSAQAHR